MRVRQEAHVENQVRVRGNAVSKSEAHERHQQWPTPGILEAVNNELAQLMDVELRRVDNDVREAADWSHSATLFANSLDDGTAPAKRVGATRLAKTALKRRVARFDENEARHVIESQLAIYAG